jgi:hypothetical protein
VRQVEVLTMQVSPQGFPSLQTRQHVLEGPVLSPSPQAVIRGVELVSSTIKSVGRNANLRRMIVILSSAAVRQSSWCRELTACEASRRFHPYADTLSR